MAPCTTWRRTESNKWRARVRARTGLFRFRILPRRSRVPSGMSMLGAPDYRTIRPDVRSDQAREGKNPRGNFARKSAWKFQTKIPMEISHLIAATRWSTKAPPSTSPNVAETMPSATWASSRPGFPLPLPATMTSIVQCAPGGRSFPSARRWRVAFVTGVTSGAVAMATTSRPPGTLVAERSCIT